MTLFAGGLGGIFSEESFPRKIPWEATRPLMGRQQSGVALLPALLPLVWGQTPNIWFFLRQAL